MYRRVEIALCMHLHAISADNRPDVREYALQGRTHADIARRFEIMIDDLRNSGQKRGVREARREYRAYCRRHGLRIESD